MGFSEKFEKAMNDISAAADDALNKAKTKYDETMTPEKKQELKEKFDKGMKDADEALTSTAEAIGKEVENFMNGTSGNNNSK